MPDISYRNYCNYNDRYGNNSNYGNTHGNNSNYGNTHGNNSNYGNIDCQDKVYNQDYLNSDVEPMSDVALSETGS